jgi:phosphatidylglycerophosphate synthase
LFLATCSAAAVFFYLHMDCLDGKQARRTKNSSPLGQLFDHGGMRGVCAVFVQP